MEEPYLVKKRTFCHPTPIVYLRNDGVDRLASNRLIDRFHEALMRARINHAVVVGEFITLFVGSRNSRRAERIRRTNDILDYLDSR